jgi:hypothetical protein
MKAVLLVLLVMSMVMVPFAASFADGTDIIKSGLLGAGAGAVGGAASGAKGGDLWKGALAGAGVNIVGGALLDSMSGEKVRSTQEVDQTSSREAYSTGYNDGYQNGYKKGYTDGYKEGLQEAYSKDKKNGPPDWAPANGYRDKQGNQ